MKSRAMALAVVAALALTIGVELVAAQDDAPARKRGPGMRERLLKEFDEDGDGKLSKDERAAAREVMKERSKARRGDRADKTGPAERDKAAKDRRGGRRGAGPLAIFAQVDTNGNCTISEDEADDAWEARRARTMKLGKDKGREIPEDNLAEMQKKFMEQLAKTEDAAKKPFNADGQGELTGEEIAKMKAAIAKLKAAREAAMKKRWESMSPEARKRILEKFDENNNGVLDPPEAARAREAMRSRRGAGGGRGDRPAGRREQIIKEFDQDGDGKLGPEEREAAKKALRERMGKRRPGGGGPGPKPE